MISINDESLLLYVRFGSGSGRPFLFMGHNMRFPESGGVTDHRDDP